MEYRCFEPSMMNVFGYSSPDSSQAGVVRTLSYNADIKNVRGFIDDSTDSKGPTQQLSSIELLNPFTGVHADFPRIGMTSTQHKHVTPSKKHSRPLIGSGINKTIPHLIGNDFVYISKEDGRVKEIDEKSQVVKIEYKSGKIGIIDLKAKVVKNVKAGFFLNSKLKHKLKEGQVVKEGDMLAYDENYFKPSTDIEGGSSSIEMSSGLLTKVALLCDAGTFEDSVMVSKDLSEDLSFDVISDKFVALGVNSFISKIVNPDDHIKSSDPLIVFENSFDESKVNDILSKLGGEEGEEILELGRNVVSSKVSGSIVDIKIFYNRPIEEFSESLQKFIKKYIKQNKQRTNTVLDSKSDDIIYTHHTDETKYAKVLGQEFDGLLIQFFVSHSDNCKSGDKISFESALKGIISEVWEEDERPTSTYDDKPIEAVLSPLSVISRMTIDFFYKLYCNKVIVSLKDECEKIWKE